MRGGLVEKESCQSGYETKGVSGNGAFMVGLEKPTLQSALVKVQSVIRSIKKEASNPFFKSKYVTLDSVCDYVYPILTKHGLCVSQVSVVLEGRQYLETKLMHVSGEQISSLWPMGTDNMKPQEIGSLSTYARRYSLMAIVGLSATDEDDDGEAAQKRNVPQAQPQALKQTDKVRQLQAIVKAKKIDNQAVLDAIRGLTGKESSKELSDAELDNIISWANGVK